MVLDRDTYDVQKYPASIIGSQILNATQKAKHRCAHNRMYHVNLSLQTPFAFPYPLGHRSWMRLKEATIWTQPQSLYPELACPGSLHTWGSQEAHNSIFHVAEVLSRLTFEGQHMTSGLPWQWSCPLAVESRLSVYWQERICQKIACREQLDVNCFGNT